MSQTTLRTALVTGASQGIGKAIAYQLAMEGIAVIGVARRAKVIDSVAKEIIKAGGARLRSLSCDLSCSADVESLPNKVFALSPRIDILVNAAGQSWPIDMEAPQNVWEEAMQLGFHAHRSITHAVLSGMQEQGWGRVITVTGTSEPRFLSASTPAKAALHVWSKAVSRLVAADGVTMNCIQPGRIRSEQLMAKLTCEDIEAAVVREIPAGKIGEPEDVAAVACFLASEQASYVTGTVIPVDGSFRHFAF